MKRRRHGVQMNCDGGRDKDRARKYKRDVKAGKQKGKLRMKKQDGAESARERSKTVGDSLN